MFSWLLGDTKLYIVIALLAVLSGFLYLRLDNTSLKLNQAQADLDKVVKINKDNEAKLGELKAEYDKQIKLFKDLNTEKGDLQKKVNDVKIFIKSSQKYNETNLTNIFNGVIDRLWDDNKSSR